LADKESKMLALTKFKAFKSSAGKTLARLLDDHRMKRYQTRRQPP
jgi:hypothetical protein